MQLRPRFLAGIFLVLSFCLACLAFAADDPPAMSNDQRGLARQMLKNTIDTVRKHYYDAKFHGIDLDARFKEADERIRNSRTLSDAFGVIAWALDGLNDSHTFFQPPSRPFDVENGWQMGFIGDKCFITAVKPGSDAATQGIKPGDQVLALEGFAPTRQTLWKMQYAFNALAPRSGFHLVVASPGAPQRPLEVHAKVHKLANNVNLTGEGAGSQDIWDLIRKQEDREQDQSWRYVELGDDLMILKLPSFIGSDSDVDNIMSRVNKHKALVLDLRDNPGGYEELLFRFLGNLFENDVKFGERTSRDEHKPLMVKGHGDRAFKGKVVVLVNSSSASAAELFARTIQLQKRGVVVGDQSSGSVMEALVYAQKGSVDTVFMYGVEVTVADLILSDGKSLEHTGVQPDELLLPTAQDLAAGRDPQLSRAAGLAGVELSAEKAGALFPVRWERQ